MTAPTYLINREICKGCLSTGASIGILLAHQVEIGIVTNYPVTNGNLVIPRRTRLLDGTRCAASERLEEMAGASVFGTSELNVRFGIVAVQIIVESKVKFFICLGIVQGKFELRGTGDCDLLRELNRTPDVVLESDGAVVIRDHKLMHLRILAGVVGHLSAHVDHSSHSIDLKFEVGNVRLVNLEAMVG